MNTKKNSTFLCALLLLIGYSLFFANAVTASPLTSLVLINSMCPIDSPQATALTQLQQQINTASSLRIAKELALEPTDLALNALENAHQLMPFSDDLNIAENRLAEKRARIVLASSQAQVADEFSGIMLAGLDNDHAAHIRAGKIGCDYSSGEVIAIVVGLILGIIPGLILLAVLC